ncbi:MAG: Calx-beta domain-containing protein, partial [Nevskia sp.]|nr:Calx-beta domain-containing protein [Nevskia sp.]
MKVLIAAAALFGASGAQANSTAQTLPFTQNWSDAGLITADDDWSAVPGIVGYLGGDITAATGVNPQTLVGEGTVTIDVIANQTNTNITNGGVAEFALANPVVALQGSGTADAPNLLINLDTSGQTNVTVACNLRDLDGSADNAVQPIALQYRVGNSGNFIDVPAGFVADATSGPSLATLVTAVSAVLPAAANNQSLVQVRIITANAVGNDEWVGIDDISISGNGTNGDLPTVSLSLTPASFSELGGSATVTATLSAAYTAPVTVNLTFGGAASNGTDYSASRTSLSIPAGDTSATVTLSAIDDTVFEGNEDISVSLGSLDGATAGTPNSVTATILENDDAPPPTIGTRIYQIQG